MLGRLPESRSAPAAKEQNNEPTTSTVAHEYRNQCLSIQLRPTLGTELGIGGVGRAALRAELFACDGGVAAGRGSTIGVACRRIAGRRRRCVVPRRRCIGRLGRLASQELVDLREALSQRGRC